MMVSLFKLDSDATQTRARGVSKIQSPIHVFLHRRWACLEVALDLHEIQTSPTISPVALEYRGRDSFCVFEGSYSMIGMTLGRLYALWKFGLSGAPTLFRISSGMIFPRLKSPLKEKLMCVHGAAVIMNYPGPTIFAYITLRTMISPPSFVHIPSCFNPPYRL
jgi:hypothetical protein